MPAAMSGATSALGIRRTRRSKIAAAASATAITDHVHKCSGDVCTIPPCEPPPSLELAGDGGEHVVEVHADEPGADDDDHRDQRREEAVLDRRYTLVVLDELLHGPVSRSGDELR